MATDLRHVFLVLCGLIWSSFQNATGSPNISGPTENTPCPAPCSCQSDPRGLFVTCQDGDMAAVIRQVPPDTYSLKYLLSDRFDDANVTFEHLEHLNTLELSSVDIMLYNKPWTIERSDIFEGLNNLRILKLHLSLDYVNPAALGYVSNLTELDLSHTRYLEKSGLVPILLAVRDFGIPIRKLGIRNIQHPSPQHVNQVLDIREDILRQLEGVPIEDLDLGSNGLVVFNPGFMEFLPKLQFLDARGNIVGGRGPNWACTTLDLFLHPALKRMAFGAIIYDNPGRYRREDVFQEDSITQRGVCFQKALDETGRTGGKDFACRWIDCLCSSYAKIPCEYVPPITEIFPLEEDPECRQSLRFLMSPQLEELHFANAASILQGNILNQKDNETFCVNKKNGLQYMDISNNRLGEAFSPGIPTVIGLTHLRFFNVQNNRAEFKIFTLFKYYVNLEYLLIGGNTVRLDLDVNSRFFQNNAKLRTLGLQDCNINFIPKLEFDMLPRLEVLNLSRNALREVDVDISNLKELRLLNLSNNEIQVLPGKFTRMLDSIAADHEILVDLSQNRIRCSCQDIAFINWLLNTKVTLVNLDDLLCSNGFSGPVSVQELVVSDLEQLCFPSYDTLITISVLCTLAVVGAIGLVVLGYRKRWTIRFHLHAARESWMNFVRKKRVATGHTYQFDAFVVYSADDRTWVHETLLKTLENEYGMRLCIHFRDFIPGHDIEDTIVESINMSRKTVVVLSPNFLKSDWCNFEFKMARQRIVIDGVDVILFVLLEDLPTEGISKTLARLLQKKTYLKWTEDEDGKRLFWDQLTKAINDKYTVDPEP